MGGLNQFFFSINAFDERNETAITTAAATVLSVFTFYLRHRIRDETSSSRTANQFETPISSKQQEPPETQSQSTSATVTASTLHRIDQAHDL